MNLDEKRALEKKWGATAIESTIPGAVHGSDEVKPLSEIMWTETYLGDGLYASYDGWHVVLRAPREGGDHHHVGLEPAVWESLLKFVARLKAGPGRVDTPGLTE